MALEFSPNQNSNIHSQSLASDKLQKAIERNRAKQNRRSDNLSSGMSTSARASERPSSTMPPLGNPRKKPPVGPSSLFGDLSGNYSARGRSSARTQGVGASESIRKTISNAQSIELVNPIQKRKKAPGVVSYLGKKKKRSKSKKNFPELLVYAGWAFNFFLFLRLLFSSNGVFDYYKMDSTLTEKKEKLQKLKEENINLVEEINQIKTNKIYQKKLARDHLGVIAKDEYLVLFAKDQNAISSN